MQIALFNWQIQNKKIICTYLTKYNTSIADLQGLECFETDDFETFIYGKGIEYIKIKKNNE
ncbi:hypothetical protein NQ314_015590 [Rhamnusium bicolor]|uniref:Uncharacterized protein n=1 Tax=Rhamnusium bicolor TaxID=1586634 RepID=A0AAV8WYG3_9CUCU|nr:hypothetical protein NQ314_015590 [Rhamnusium bicolor]